MSLEFIVKLSLEYFLASGERTRKRLNELVSYNGEVYGWNKESIATFQRDAWKTYVEKKEVKP